MAIFKLIKDGEIVNTIVATEEVAETLKNEYDSVEEVIIESPEIDKLISSTDVRNAMTLIERVSWDNSSTSTIVTAKIEFTNPIPIEQATEVLNFMVTSNDISEETKNKILEVYN